MSVSPVLLESKNYFISLPVVVTAGVATFFFTGKGDYLAHILASIPKDNRLWGISNLGIARLV